MTKERENADECKNQCNVANIGFDIGEDWCNQLQEAWRV